MERFDSEIVLSQYSETAVEALRSAQEEAHRLGHNTIGTEFIFLGLLGDRTTLAGEILTGELSITLKDARKHVENSVGTGSGFTTEEPHFTPRGRMVLTLANHECNRLNGRKTGPEHILLALLGDDGGIALSLLQNNYNIKPGELRMKLLNKLSC